MTWVLPDSVTVGHLDISVVPMTKAESEKRNELGSWDDVTCTINVLETLPPFRQAEVFLHELFHVCYLVYQINPKWGEEKTVDGFALAMSSVIRQNPDLFPCLQLALTRKAAK